MQSTGGSIPSEAGPLLSGGVLELSAGDDEARVSVTDLTIGKLAADLPRELREQLDQLEAACQEVEQAPGEAVPDILGELPIGVEQPSEADLTEFCTGLLDGEFANLATIDTLQVECNGDTGTVRVLGASALGSVAPLRPGERRAGHRAVPGQPAHQRDPEPAEHRAAGRFHRRRTCRLAGRG
jgi:hypothetical protein